MNDNELSALGAHIKNVQDRTLGKLGVNEAARRRLSEHVAQRKAKAPGSAASPWLRWPVWAPLGVALASLALLGTRELLWPVLQFELGHEGRAGVLRQWAEAPEQASLPVRFSDGTRIELEPGARARVVAVSRLGAELVLESGHAHVDVVPVQRWLGPNAWRIDSGPFSVEVKGTRFAVAWDPRSSEFALDLFEGSVTVKGCGRDSVSVAAGQGVRASCDQEHWAMGPIAGLTEFALRARKGESTAQAGTSEVSPSLDVSPAETAPAQAPTATVDERGGAPAQASSRGRGRLPAATPSAAPTQPQLPGWQALAREGRYKEAYASIGAARFASECERANAEQLLLLGDVARLSGNALQAGEAYAGVRRRFAATVSAARAAFALGRSKARSDPASAETWFETYLREEPGGPFSQAAWDWLLELAAQAGNPEQQRKRARGYLDRYPNGAHAQDARRLLQAPSATP